MVLARVTASPQPAATRDSHAPNPARPGRLRVAHRLRMVHPPSHWKARLHSVDAYNLEAAVKALTGHFREIEKLYLFGSRRFSTGSSRSDVDILVVLNAHLKPLVLRDYLLETSNAFLDLFIVERGRATSIVNESFIERGSTAELISLLNADLLFDRDVGTSEALRQMKNVEVDRRASHAMTVLPGMSDGDGEILALQKYFKRARDLGLPTRPYLGVSAEDAAELLVEVMRRLPSAAQQVTAFGQARKGWTAALKSEYDYQNLFWISVKPWLPNLGREEVALRYDDQDKRSDFSLFKSQIIIEMKHIKDDGSKRAVLKTLQGLRSFYEQHPNVRVLLFAILVDTGVDLDDAKWEADFSYSQHAPKVRTIVVRNPAPF